MKIKAWRVPSATKASIDGLMVCYGAAGLPVTTRPFRHQGTRWVSHCEASHAERWAKCFLREYRVLSHTVPPEPRVFAHLGSTRPAKLSVINESS